MNNIIDFVLRLKDLTSGPVQRIAQAAQSSFGRVDASVSRSQNNVTGLGRTVSGLNTRLNELTRQRDLMVNTGDLRRANMEIAAIERRMARMRGEGVSGGGGGMRLPGWMGMAAVGAGVGAGISGIVKAGANAQQDLIGLTTFLGKDQAGKVYEQIQKDAAATPFGTKGLLSANRALISAGVSAGNARADVLGLANAIAATGGGDDELGRMAQNMQQIRNAGVATAADIKQFGFAGINIYQLLANATGKTTTQVKDMQVSYSLLSKSLRMAAQEGGIYAGAMEAQSKSISGKWSTLMDNLDIAMAKIGMSQANAITGLVDTLIGVTDRLPALANEWAGGIAVMVKGVISLTERLIGMAKWLYHNWYWLKYVAGVAVGLYGTIKLLSLATGVYNSLLVIAAMRATLLGTATAGAAAATTGLNLAMLATPWGAAALAIGGVVAAMVLLKDNTDDVKDSTTAALMELNKYGSAGSGMAGVSSSGGGGNSMADNLKGWGAYLLNEVGVFVKNINTPLPAFVQMRKRLDTLGESDFQKMLYKMNGIDKLGVPLPTVPASMYNGGKKSNLKGEDIVAAVEGTGSSITGGGARGIYVNFKNVVENMNITGATAMERKANMEAELKDVIDRIFAGLPS